MLGTTPDQSIESMFKELLDKVQKMKDQLKVAQRLTPDSVPIIMSE